jgi:hypothetical protein
MHVGWLASNLRLKLVELGLRGTRLKDPKRDWTANE